MSAGLLLSCADIPEDPEVAAAVRALEVDASATDETTESTDPNSSLGGEVTDNGAVVFVGGTLLRGSLVANTGTSIYLGIPYAQPPVGAARFRPPQPIGSLGGVRAADSFGPACVQPPGPFSATGPQSEDCLTLNVYVPKAASGAPVMVFIHGGAFITGAGSQFDGQRLAEVGGVIIVTINYRLGPLGLLSLPELDAEGTPSGNNALRDQQLALSWVKNNIQAFGGDAANVTVFGQSAGSVSACLQLVSPLSRNLAKNFIMQSGACDATGTTASLAQARAVSARVVSAFCAGRSDVAACLRDVPASDLAGLRLQTSILDLSLLPVVNPADPVLPRAPKDLIATGDYNRSGNLIIGSNAREFRLFQLSRSAPVVQNIAGLNDVIDARFGPLAPLVERQYTAASDAEANDTLERLGTDLTFRCPSRALARRTAGQGSRVFLYHFEEGDALHAFELPYVFGTPIPSLGTAPLVENVRQQFQTAFTRFARSGEARPARIVDRVLFEELTPWPVYTAATDRHIALKNDVGEGNGLSKADCDFLESIGAVQ